MAMFNNARYVSGDENVQVPAHLNFGKFVLHRLRSMGDDVAIENADTGEQLTYKQLKQYAVDLAVALAQLGMAKGDVVAFGSERRNEYFATLLAIVFTGATYTPLEVHCGRSVLKHKLSITQPKYLICSKLFWEINNEIIKSYGSIKTVITLDNFPAFAESVEQLTSNHYDVERFEPAQVQGQDDIAFVLYSSGTTGMPKGVQLTHLNCILSSLPECFADESLKTAMICNSWPHNYDTFMIFKFLCFGRKIVYVNEDTQEALLRCLESHKINVAIVAPSTVTIMSKIDEKSAVNYESLQLIYSRSCPLHVKTINKLKQRFPSIRKVLQGYGMTEAGEPASENWSPNGPKPGSVGRPSPGVTLKVVNPDTQEVLGPNLRGEIRVRGPVLMKGYIGIDQATILDKDGFFKTGDLGYYDQDGYFYIVERMKEIIMYDGFNIAPLELETVLLLHPDVKEVGVVGKPVPIVGEEPAAFVVRQSGSTITEQQLLDFVKDEVAPYMQLRGGIRFISQIPRNLRGKIIRNQLREMLAECCC